MGTFLTKMTIVLIGILSYANPGVLENVAKNRAAGLTKYSVRQNWDKFDVLIATESCLFIDREGFMVVDNKKYTVLVVDCQNPKEVKNGLGLTNLGLVADQTNKNLTHKKAVIVLKGSNK